MGGLTLSPGLSEAHDSRALSDLTDGLTQLPLASASFVFTDGSSSSVAGSSIPMTFSRASMATMVGSNGLISYAPHNICPSGSEMANGSYWIANGTPTRTAAFAAGPLSGTVAARLTGTQLGDGYYISPMYSVLKGQPLTVSCYLKDNGGVTKPFIVGFGGPGVGGDQYLQCNASTGAFTSAGLYTNTAIENLGNGWYRFSGTIIASATGVIAAIAYATGANDILAYGFQGELATAAGPYYSTTNGSGYYGPRYTYSPAVTRNLLLYSEQFDNAAWSKILGTTVVPNAVAGPDGFLTADQLIFPGVTNSERFEQDIGITAVSAGTYTHSVWMKGSGVIRLCLDSSGGGGASIETIETLTASWQRFSVTTSFTAANVGNIVARIMWRSSEAVPTLLYASGAQVESTAAAGTYVRTTASATTGAATMLGLLIEGAATNGEIYSQEFDNGVWTKSGATITVDQLAAPDGTTTADLFTASGGAVAHAFYSQSLVPAATTVRTYSVFVKAGTGRYFAMRGMDTTAGTPAFPWVTLDTTNGAVQANGVVTTSGATQYPGGWWRLWMTSTEGATGGTSGTVLGCTNVATATVVGQSLPPAYTSTETFYVWGVQAEVSPIATSHIPTGAAAVARVRDSCTFAAGPWLNRTQGTWFAEARSAVTDATPRRIVGSSGFNDSAPLAIYGIADALQTSSWNGSVELRSPMGSVPVGVVKKIAMSFKPGARTAAAGGQLASDTSYAADTATTFSIGDNPFGDYPIDAPIARIKYWPYALSDDELRVLTT
jgi:hypothetical protein